MNYRICNLYSGSGGNSTLVCAGGAKILIDAGKTYKALKAALADVGVRIDEIDAVFVTHEHRDHVGAVRTLSHKHGTPIHMLLDSAMIYNGLCDEKLCNALQLYRGREFCAEVAALKIKAFPVPHDSRAAVGYRLTFNDGEGEVSVGISTDIGRVTDEIRNGLSGCESVVIESNHDKEMLAQGPYPEDLKARIRSGRGHLSNDECAAFVCELCASGTKNVMLAHLSEENNHPTLALSEVSGAIADGSVNLKVARQDESVWLVGESELPQ